MRLTNFFYLVGIADPKGFGWLAVLFSFFLSCAVTWGLIPSIRKFALRVNWIDQPNERRMNQKPLPNTGGLAIYTGVIVAIIIVAFLRQTELQRILAQVQTILLGGSILVLVGFIDDQFELSPYVRILIQVLTALLLIGSDIIIKVDFGSSFDSLLSALLSLMWIVGITNAVNFMDGIDGLVGGVSFITSMTLLAVSAQFPNRAAVTIILSALSGGSLGFLRYNAYPSVIIMGDAGAYFFGYVIAAVSILSQIEVTSAFSFASLFLFLLLPLLDAVQVIAVRLFLRKNPLSSPGQDHIHHYLISWGFSQRLVALFFWSVSLICDIFAMKLQGINLISISCTTVAIIALLSLVVWWKGKSNYS
jgi:UDP-GlcNAc:undecaprenyl-phosphate/decaprenyl-phosphate GlcNAc-1-phosphate transferase